MKDTFFDKTYTEMFRQDYQSSKCNCDKYHLSVKQDGTIFADQKCSYTVTANNVYCADCGRFIGTFDLEDDVDSKYLTQAIWGLKSVAK